MPSFFSPPPRPALMPRAQLAHRIIAKKKRARASNSRMRPTKPAKKTSWGQPVRDVGLCMIVLVPHGHETEKSILPLLGTIDAFSKGRFHVVLPGYIAGQADELARMGGVNDWQKIDVPFPDPWHYSGTILRQDIDRLEALTKWRYQHGVEILIFDINRVAAEGKTIWEVLAQKHAHLDEVIVCNLDNIKSAGLIDSFDDFFNRIRMLVTAALDGGEVAITHNVSDRLGLKSANVIANVAEAFGKDKSVFKALLAVFRLKHFAVRDIRKK